MCKDDQAQTLVSKTESPVSLSNYQEIKVQVRVPGLRKIKIKRKIQIKGKYF